MPAPLAVSIVLPFVQPSVGSRNSPPPLSTVTLPQLRMLIQSTHEDRHGAEAPAEPGERIVKSPPVHESCHTHTYQDLRFSPPIYSHKGASFPGICFCERIWAVGVYRCVLMGRVHILIRG